MENRLKKIALVDDDAVNLVSGKNILGKQYEVFTVSSGEKLFKILGQMLPDIILLDIEMPEMDGYDVIKRLKSEARTAGIPVIFLTARIDVGSELEGLTLGAVDYITKPLEPSLLLKRIENHLFIEEQKHLLLEQSRRIQDYSSNLEKMVEVKTRSVSELQTAIFNILAEIVEYRDDETGGHVHRTQRYLQVLLNGLKKSMVYQDEISSWDLRLLGLSSQLHDLGKIATPDSVLLKPGKLTPEEFAEIQKHPAIGGEIIERFEHEMVDNLFIQYAKQMAVSHHEKWDGSGYPHKLAGNDIPLQGRLMAIVDVYDALVSERPYKKPFTHEEAVRIISEGAGKHFDPLIVKAFLGVADEIEQIRKKYAEKYEQEHKVVES